MKMKTYECKICEDDFSAQKYNAQFCSNACRMKHERKKRNGHLNNNYEFAVVLQKKMKSFVDSVNKQDLTKKELEKIVFAMKREAKLLEAVANALIQKQQIKKMLKELNK